MNPVFILLVILEGIVIWGVLSVAINGFVKWLKNIIRRAKEEDE